MKKIVNNYMKLEGQSWFALCLVGSFMFCIFAPLDTFFTNKSEFWFDFAQLLMLSVFMFLIVFCISFAIAVCLSRTKIAVYIYAALFCLFIYFYVQGNFIQRNYGVLNGKDIVWEEYTAYAAASIILIAICIVLYMILSLKVKDKVFKVGKLVCIFILLIQMVSLITLWIQDKVSGADTHFKSKVVTDKGLLDLSDDGNIIIFILDSYDASYLNELLVQDDAEEYKEILRNFTFYPDTLGAYPTTKASIPYILTGERYENEKPYTEYVENAYIDNTIYGQLDINGYDAGIYTDSMFLPSNVDFFINVQEGVYKVTDYISFAKKIVKLTAFNYMPHQLKKYFVVDTDSFLDLRKIKGKNTVYSKNDQEFYKKIVSKGISISQEKKQFKVYHLNGVHVPYTFDRNMISNPNAEYTSYDEAAGNLMMLQKYFDELKMDGVYENTSIIIMADHGQIDFQQNPLFMVKNAGEDHSFAISDEKMSYEYLSDIFVSLVNGKPVTEKYIQQIGTDNGLRHFLYYEWDASWDREYLPFMSEFFVKGNAGKADHLIRSGVNYEPGDVDMSHKYSLGQALTFDAEGNADEYCILGIQCGDRWTSSDYAFMQFVIEDDTYKNLMLQMEYGIYKEHQHVRIYANNHIVADYEADDAEKKDIVIPGEYVQEDGKLMLYFEFPDAEMPDNGDVRKLALWMQSMSITGTEENANAELPTD